MTSTYNYAMVCSSNMNRSMQGHLLLSDADFRVESFGIGSKVRLPSSSPTRQHVYDFGTKYSTIRDDLIAHDELLYVC